jgi:hypothetical protein
MRKDGRPVKHLWSRRREERGVSRERARVGGAMAVSMATLCGVRKCGAPIGTPRVVMPSASMTKLSGGSAAVSVSFPQMKLFSCLTVRPNSAKIGAIRGASENMMAVSPLTEVSSS